MLSDLCRLNNENQQLHDELHGSYELVCTNFHIIATLKDENENLMEENEKLKENDNRSQSSESKGLMSELEQLQQQLAEKEKMIDKLLIEVEQSKVTPGSTTKELSEDENISLTNHEMDLSDESAQLKIREIQKLCVELATIFERKQNEIRELESKNVETIDKAESNCQPKL